MCRSSKICRLCICYRAGIPPLLGSYKQLSSPALLKWAVTLSPKRPARFCLALGPGRIAYSFSEPTPPRLCIPMCAYTELLAKNHLWAASLRCRPYGSGLGESDIHREGEWVSVLGTSGGCESTPGGRKHYQNSDKDKAYDRYCGSGLQCSVWRKGYPWRCIPDVKHTQ